MYVIPALISDAKDSRTTTAIILLYFNVGYLYLCLALLVEHRPGTTGGRVLVGHLTISAIVFTVLALLDG